MAGRVHSINGVWQTVSYAKTRLSRRYGDCARVAHRIALSLISSEIEKFVLLNGPADAASKLFHRQLGGCWEERIARIERSIAARRETRAVKTVGARLQSHINLGARFPTKLCFGVL